MFASFAFLVWMAADPFYYRTKPKEYAKPFTTLQAVVKKPASRSKAKTGGHPLLHEQPGVSATIPHSSPIGGTVTTNVLHIVIQMSYQ
jgi:hypothetical protein